MQQPFTNETIFVSDLPKFEDVTLQPLQKAYFKVIVFSILVFTVLIFTGISIAYFLFTTAFTAMIWLVIFSVPLVLILILMFYAKLSFNKKGYAFRTHDAVFKSGVISETTTIVPFNRVQHVALHQGFISRKLGLAAIELFTAGGSASDLEIPGLLLEDAQKIKNLIAQKINPEKEKQITDVTPNSIESNE